MKHANIRREYNSCTIQLCCSVKIPKNIEKPNRIEMLKQGTVGMEIMTGSPTKN